MPVCGHRAEHSTTWETTRLIWSNFRRGLPAAVSKLDNMLPAEEAGGAEGRTPATNQTVRSVFIIGPGKKIKLILTYPMTTGRNFDAVLRVLDSMQLTAKYKVSTPVKRKEGDDVIIAGSVSDEDAKKFIPGGLEGAQTLHANCQAAGLAEVRFKRTSRETKATSECVLVPGAAFGGPELRRILSDPLGDKVQATLSPRAWRPAPGCRLTRFPAGVSDRASRDTRDAASPVAHRPNREQLIEAPQLAGPEVERGGEVSRRPRRRRREGTGAAHRRHRLRIENGVARRTSERGADDLSRRVDREPDDRDALRGSRERCFRISLLRGDPRQHLALIGRGVGFGGSNRARRRGSGGSGRGCRRRWSRRRRSGGWRRTGWCRARSDRRRLLRRGSCDRFRRRRLSRRRDRGSGRRRNNRRLIWRRRRFGGGGLFFNWRRRRRFGGGGLFLNWRRRSGLDRRRDGGRVFLDLRRRLRRRLRLFDRRRLDDNLHSDRFRRRRFGNGRRPGQQGRQHRQMHGERRADAPTSRSPRRVFRRRRLSFSRPD
jgi:hypothetical protein